MAAESPGDRARAADRTTISFNHKQPPVQRWNPDATECLQGMNGSDCGAQGTQRCKNVRAERDAGVQNDFALKTLPAERGEAIHNAGNGRIWNGNQKKRRGKNVGGDLARTAAAANAADGAPCCGGASRDHGVNLPAFFLQTAAERTAKSPCTNDGNSVSHRHARITC